MTRDQIENLFQHHNLTPQKMFTVEQIRAKGLEFALFIQENTPTSPEQTLAVRAAHQAAMMAVLALAVNE